jgi:hypothetical protein
MVATNPDITRRDLMFAPRQLRVIQYSYLSPLITTVHNPTTGALALPDDGQPVGLHEKRSGGRLANAVTINDIRSHGEGGPTRQLPTQRDITVGLTPQETTKQNLENWLGTDLSGVGYDEHGGITFGVDQLPDVILSRTVLLGKDKWNSLPWYIAWIGNRTNISQRSETALTDAEVATYPYTINFQGVDELLGQPLIVDIFGPGWEAMLEAGVDPGFAGWS